MQVEEVVNAILEGNLAPHLISLDQGLQRQPRKQSDPQVPGRGIYFYALQLTSHQSQ